MLDLATKVNVSVQAVAQLLVVAGSGSWLAKRHGLNKQAIGALASVIWHAFLPALLFSSILGAINSERLSTLWPLLVFSVLHAAIGASASLALGLVARLPRY